MMNRFEFELKKFMMNRFEKEKSLNQKISMMLIADRRRSLCMKISKEMR